MQSAGDSEWLTQAWHLTQAIIPWLTGGLAGAVLTYALNQRLQRKNRSRLTISTRRTEFTIGSHDGTFKDLLVSYAGRTYDSLQLLDLAVTNTAQKTVAHSPVLLTLGADAQVVEHKSSVRPINRQVDLLAQPTEPGVFIWDPGELKPQDSARLRLLIASAGAIEWAFRGDDDVEVVDGGNPTSGWLDVDVRFFILLAFLWVLLGAIPLLGAMIQVLILVAYSPVIVKLAKRIKTAANTSSRSFSAPSVLISGANADVAVSYDQQSGASRVEVASYVREK